MGEPLACGEQRRKLHRLESTVSRNAQNAVLSSWGYGYNAANQRTKATTEDGSYWKYGYDALGQVTSGSKRGSVSIR